MKVLVCGDRFLIDRAFVYWALTKYLGEEDDLTIIEGEAPGADKMAADWAEKYNATVKRFPADWERYGKAAGPIRNQKMLMAGPELVIAFHWNLFEKSRGTLDMVARAHEAGVPVILLSGYRR